MTSGSFAAFFVGGSINEPGKFPLDSFRKERGLFFVFFPLGEGIYNCPDAVLVFAGISDDPTFFPALVIDVVRCV